MVTTYVDAHSAIQINTHCDPQLTAPSVRMAQKQSRLGSKTRPLRWNRVQYSLLRCVVPAVSHHSAGSHRILLTMCTGERPRLHEKHSPWLQR